MKYDVLVAIAASQGGSRRTVSVDAPDKALAIVAASSRLERENITRWKLVSVVPATS